MKFPTCSFALVLVLATFSIHVEAQVGVAPGLSAPINQLEAIQSQQQQSRTQARTQARMDPGEATSMKPKSTEAAKSAGSISQGKQKKPDGDGDKTKTSGAYILK